MTIEAKWLKRLTSRSFFLVLFIALVTRPFRFRCSRAGPEDPRAASTP